VKIVSETLVTVRLNIPLYEIQDKYLTYKIKNFKIPFSVQFVVKLYLVETGNESRTSDDHMISFKKISS